MAKKFKKLIRSEKPDLIIGTHPFPMIALSTLKKTLIYIIMNQMLTQNIFINIIQIPLMFLLLFLY